MTPRPCAAPSASRSVATSGVDTEDMAGSGFERREHAVALVRRRLCLTPERDGEIARALGPRLREHDGLWSAGPREQRVVTLWWDVDALRRRQP